MAKQKYIRTEYSDGDVVLSNIRKGRESVPVIGSNDNYTATKVTTWYDGSPMTPEKADGSVYLQLSETGEYFKVNLPNDGELFLEKDTVAQLRDMSAVEILLLRMGYYKGVTLQGYYTKGDTPAPIQYYLSDTTEEDDGGSVFEVGGIKLEHKFKGDIYVSYFGAFPEMDDSNIQINNALKYSSDNSRNSVRLSEGRYLASGSISSERSFVLEGTGYNKTSIAATAEMDSLLDMYLTDDLYFFKISGISFSGGRLTKEVGNINRCHYFTLEDVRFTGGLDFGLRVGTSWCWNLVRVNCSYNRNGLLVDGITDTVNNNGTLDSCRIFLNDEVGAILKGCRDTKFSNCVVEANPKLGLLVGASCRGLSYDSMYLEFNGDGSGVDVSYQGGDQVVNTQIILAGSTWENPSENTPIVPGNSFPPRTIAFHNVMIVKSSSDINRDTITVLNCENLYINSNWSSSGINLVAFKDSQTTMMNNLITENNRVGTDGEFLKLDYSERRTSTPSNAKTWIIKENKNLVNLNVPISRFSIQGALNSIEQSGNYNGEDIYTLNIGAPSTLNFYTVLPASVVNSNKLYFSIKYKSDTNFSIVQQYTGIVNVNNFPASPDDFSEATIVLLDDVPTNQLIISVGRYSDTGEVQVVSPEVGVIGNPSTISYIRGLATEESVIIGEDDKTAVTPLTLQTKLNNLVASPTVKGLVNQSTSVEDITTPDATDEQTTMDLVNELKEKINELLSSDRASGQRVT